MKKFLILYIPLCFALLLVVAGCKKKNNPSTPFGKILGRWKLAQIASDDNGSGGIDNFEISNVAKGLDKELKFNSDGTGVETYTYGTSKEPDQSFTWAISDVEVVTLVYKAHDTLVYEVKNNTANELTLTTNSSQGLQWFLYQRQ